MALIKCKECGKEFSDTSNVCPHCGWTRRKQAGLLSGLLSIFLVIVGSCFGFVAFMGLMASLVEQGGCNMPKNVSNSAHKKLMKKETSVNIVLEPLEKLIQKNKETPDFNICTKGIPVLKNIINTKGYQTEVLKVLDILHAMPTIKKCPEYGEIKDTLDMADGYKNIKWGTSLEKARASLGKMWFASWQNENEFSPRWDILISFPQKAFFVGSQYESLGEENDRRTDTDKGLVSARALKMYVQGDKRFLFYKDNFFAYAEDLPWADNENLYLHNLQKKYGRNTTRRKSDFGLDSVNMIHTWIFGNTYIVLHDFHNVLYIDKQTLDKLHTSYQETQNALVEEQKAWERKRQQKALSAANNL